MGTIATFDHTADVGLRITAADLDDLFRTAAEGLFDYIVANRGEVRALATETIALGADSQAELLILWLSELIFRCETEHRIYTHFDIRTAPDGLSMTAAIGGEPIDRNRHILDHEVKAVTRHGLTLQFQDDTWIAEFILDI